MLTNQTKSNRIDQKRCKTVPKSNNDDDNEMKKSLQIQRG